MLKFELVHLMRLFPHYLITCGEYVWDASLMGLVTLRFSQAFEWKVCRIRKYSLQGMSIGFT
jgi:hypothetical protein